MDSHLSQHKPPKCLQQAEGQSRQVLARRARIRQPLLPPPGRKTQRGLQPRGILQLHNRPELDQPSRGDNRKLSSRGPLRANPRRSAHRNPRVALGRTAPRLKLIDGPAAATYRCEREPTYLRAVLKSYPNTPRNRDVMDQNEDVPEPDETVFAYRRQREPTSVIACGLGSARCSHIEDIDGETLRDTDTWRA